MIVVLSTFNGLIKTIKKKMTQGEGCIKKERNGIDLKKFLTLILEV